MGVDLHYFLQDLDQKNGRMLSKRWREFKEWLEGRIAARRYPSPSMVLEKLAELEKKYPEANIE